MTMGLAEDVHGRKIKSDKEGFYRGSNAQPASPKWGSYNAFQCNRSLGASNSEIYTGTIPHLKRLRFNPETRELPALPQSRPGGLGSGAGYSYIREYVESNTSIFPRNLDNLKLTAVR
jgi:hypothetical protein